VYHQLNRLKLTVVHRQWKGRKLPNTCMVASRRQQNESWTERKCSELMRAEGRGDKNEIRNAS